MKKMYLKGFFLLAVLFGSMQVFAQTTAQIQKITKDYDQSRLSQLEQRLSQINQQQKQLAKQQATQRGLALTLTLDDGGFAELQRILPDGTPIYYRTFNVDAARSTRTNHLNAGGSLGLNLMGQNMTAHVWDGGHGRVTHQEYDGAGGNNRLTIRDIASEGGTQLNFHAAHVSGTIMASGVQADAKGMAPHTKVDGYMWNNDIAEAAAAAANGMLISNHSYGFRGDLVPDQYFGAYIDESRNWDEVMHNAPSYLMVVAAGNDGNQNGYNGAPLDGNSSYDKLTGHSTSKNNLVVANAQDANIAADGTLLSVTINSSSSEGPTDDYRIKPDITGNGTGVYSTYQNSDTAYNSITGTSMASPNVAGSLLLLQQHYNNTNAAFAKAATIKGLALHTADDIGPTGPDAVHGWGLLNAKKAAETITGNGSSSIVDELTLTNGGSYQIQVDANGGPLLASISWTDLPGTATTATNSSTSRLVNDLDIRVTKSGTTSTPWRLTGVTTNGKGDNTVDPYERVDIDNATGTYTITVTHKGSLSGGNQAFTLIVTGTGTATPPPPITCSTTVSSFPYNEGFENTLGAWSQDSSNDFDWTINSGGTPSNSTGPAAAFEGTYYVYMEASDPNFGGKTTILNSPCFDLAGVTTPTANFHYQMTGNSVGTIRLEARLDGENTWTELWSQSGDQGAAWIDQDVSLAAYSGNTVQLRFRGTTNTSWQGDIAIDGFSIEGTQAGDTQAPTVPTNLAVTGVTTSSVALSWTASTDNVGVTAYDVFQGSSNLGEVTGTTANVTGLAEGTTYQFSVRAKDAAGNVSANSNTVSATTDTTAPPGGCTGGVNSLPYGESFEANLGLWTQAGGDDLNWTRDSGGTPSNNTGPSSGSDGSFYVYVEASGNGTGFPNKRAILNSPCFDLSAQTEASFIFDYHMFGSTDGGRVDLEASTDDGATWTSIWNQTGNQGNQWNNVTIDLAAYVGGSVQLRFNRITGGTWQSDVAIDNTRVVAGGGNDPNPPSGYCASNGQNTNDEYISRVQIGSIDNSTGASAGGYGDFTNLSTNLSGSANITITPTWTGTVYNEAYTVFIDWNRDGDFADAGETAFTQAPTQATSISGTITVPSGAAQGPTRMRVSMKYNAAPTACESFNFGEAEDYIVNVSSSTTNTSFSDPNALDNTTSSISSFDFTVFPNPVTRGQLSVNVIGAEAENYTIYNMLGQTVHKGAFIETVDVSKLKAGMYIIEITIGNENHTKRFIKK
ncbi:S8 family serine peptidase [uncultured Dokdonia sp.]|uniref:S8 family serine peptidase n=1 Tax=uncultured Dokdonia sp. TaxID=575653 RepID=UPI00262C8537|nr:S8 family serine peptidase [uncultured Dokdonia sp.]